MSHKHLIIKYMTQGIEYAPQITHLENVSGNVIKNQPFMIKVIGDRPVQLSVKLVNDEEFIQTIFDAGWNPEIVKEIQSVSEGVVQIGY